MDPYRTTNRQNWPAAHQLQQLPPPPQGWGQQTPPPWQQPTPTPQPPRRRPASARAWVITAVICAAIIAVTAAVIFRITAPGPAATPPPPGQSGTQGPAVSKEPNLDGTYKAVTDWGLYPPANVDNLPKISFGTPELEGFSKQIDEPLGDGWMTYWRSTDDWEMLAVGADFHADEYPTQEWPYANVAYALWQEHLDPDTIRRVDDAVCGVKKDHDFNGEYCLMAADGFTLQFTVSYNAGPDAPEPKISVDELGAIANQIYWYAVEGR